MKLMGANGAKEEKSFVGIQKQIEGAASFTNYVMQEGKFWVKLQSHKRGDGSGKE